MGNAKRQNLLTRCIKLMNVLAPHIVSGLSVTELSEKTGLPAAVVCRDMDELAARGLGTKAGDRTLGPDHQAHRFGHGLRSGPEDRPASVRTISNAISAPGPSG